MDVLVRCHLLDEPFFGTAEGYDQRHDVSEDAIQTGEFARCSASKKEEAAAVSLIEVTVGDFQAAPVAWVLTVMPKLPWAAGGRRAPTSDCLTGPRHCWTRPAPGTSGGWRPGGSQSGDWLRRRPTSSSRSSSTRPWAGCPGFVPGTRCSRRMWSGPWRGTCGPRWRAIARPSYPPACLGWSSRIHLRGWEPEEGDRLVFAERAAPAPRHRGRGEPVRALSRPGAVLDGWAARSQVSPERHRLWAWIPVRCSHIPRRRGAIGSPAVGGDERGRRSVDRTGLWLGEIGFEQMQPHPGMTCSASSVVVQPGAGCAEKWSTRWGTRMVRAGNGGEKFVRSRRDAATRPQRA